MAVPCQSSSPSALFLVEKSEKEIQCGVSHRHTFGGAEKMVVAVADVAVRIHLPENGVVAVAHRAVTLNLTQIRVVPVPHGAVRLDFAQKAVTFITYGAV